MVLKNVGGGGGKQGARIMGSVKMVNLVPVIKKIWCLICFVVYQIYADTLIRCEVEAIIRLKSVLFYNQDR